MTIRQYLDKNRILTDGAMGTYYAKLEKQDGAISELANLSNPNKIKQIHKEYIRAGANIIRTNTFAANTKTLHLTKQEQEQIIAAACQIARDAVEEEGKEVFLAGDMGPIAEQAITEPEEVLEEYKRMCDLFLEQGVDILLFETFSSTAYIKEIIDYVRSKSNVFIMMTFCLNKNGYTSLGVSGKRLLDMAGEMEGLDCIGFNCGIGSGHMLELVKKMEFPEHKYIAIVPNAGYPEQLQNRMVFLDNATYFSDNMAQIAQLGAHIVGGCCGTTPKYIKALTNKITMETKEISKVRICSVAEEKESVPVQKNEFYELFSTGKKVVAVELDPPYDAEYDKLIQQAHAVKRFGADMITIADSPMGRSRVDSILMSVKIAKEVEIPVMPHVCCRDKNMIAMRSGLLGAYINDIRNLLVVTGDPVPGVSRANTSSVFDYNSIRLMEFVKEMNVEHFSKDPIYFGGALNYGRGKIEKVMERMEKKIEAGATYFLTQPVYCEEDIERLRFIRKKLDTKLLCGILPFVSYRNANFIKNEMSGIFVPDEVVERYTPDMSKEEAELVGANLANELIEKMNDFADGYYFMLPFNRVSLLEKIKVQ